MGGTSSRAASCRCTLGLVITAAKLQVMSPASCTASLPRTTRWEGTRPTRRGMAPRGVMMASFCTRNFRQWSDGAFLSSGFSLDSVSVGDPYPVLGVERSAGSSATAWILRDSMLLEASLCIRGREIRSGVQGPMPIGATTWSIDLAWLRCITQSQLHQVPSAAMALKGLLPGSHSCCQITPA